MISAIILAAGQSRRMGQPKMLLPWGNRTVIEHVVVTFLTAGVEAILVVTGAEHHRVKMAVDRYPVLTVHNKDHAAGDMLSSIQCGLRAMPAEVQAALIGLGDQPQVQEKTIRSIHDAYRDGAARLVVPSFQLKRGHPWLVARPLWDEILTLEPPETPRDFLNRFGLEILYVNMNTPTILADLDTPEDYMRSRP
jgi:molybdenum cofactor cytidylyltransferase